MMNLKAAPLLALALLAPAVARAAPPGKPAGFRIPVEVKKLANGLTVVVSEDHSAPPSASPPPTASASASSPRAAPASPTSSST